MLLIFGLLLLIRVASAVVHCTGQFSWLGNGYHVSDCGVALENIYYEDVESWGGADFEFVAPGGTPVHAEPRMHTPLKYTHGETSMI